MEVLAKLMEVIISQRMELNQELYPSNLHNIISQLQHNKSREQIKGKIKLKLKRSQGAPLPFLPCDNQGENSYEFMVSLNPNYFSRAPPPNTLIGGIELQHVHWRVGHKHSVHHTCVGSMAMQTNGERHYGFLFYLCH